MVGTESGTTGRESVKRGRRGKLLWSFLLLFIFTVTTASVLVIRARGHENVGGREQPRSDPEDLAFIESSAGWKHEVDGSYESRSWFNNSNSVSCGFECGKRITVAGIDLKEFDLQPNRECEELPLELIYGMYGPDGSDIGSEARMGWQGCLIWKINGEFLVKDLAPERTGRHLQFNPYYVTHKVQMLIEEGVNTNRQLQMVAVPLFTTGSFNDSPPEFEKAGAASTYWSETCDMLNGWFSRCVEWIGLGIDDSVHVKHRLALGQSSQVRPLTKIEFGRIYSKREFTVTFMSGGTGTRLQVSSGSNVVQCEPAYSSIYVTEATEIQSCIGVSIFVSADLCGTSSVEAGIYFNSCVSPTTNVISDRGGGLTSWTFTAGETTTSSTFNIQGTDYTLNEAHLATILVQPMGSA